MVHGDLLGLQTYAATQNERKKAEIRLEIMTHREIMGTLSFMISIGFISFAMTICFVILGRTAEVTIDLTPDDTPTIYLPGLLGLDLGVRYFSFAMLVSLLLTFGRKIINKSLRANESFLGEQSVVILLALILFFGPGVWIGHLLDYSRTFEKQLQIMDMDRGNEFGAITILSPPHSLYGDVSELMAVVMTAASISLFQFFFLVLKSTLSRPKEVSEETDRIEISGWAICAPRRIFQMLHRLFIEPFEHVHLPVFWILFFSLLYFELVLITSRIFHFMPSFIPLVSIVPIMKVCFLDAREFYDQHQELQQEGLSLHRENFTLPESGTSFCSDPEVAGRVVSQMFIFAFELGFMFYSIYVTKYTRSAIQKLRYSHHRSRHLGFQFFSFTTGVLFFFVTLNSAILVTVPRLDLWIIKYKQNAFKVDPLHAMGLPAESLGMASNCLLFAATLVTWALAYLPASADSAVAFVWSWMQKTICRPCSSKLKLQEDRTETVYFSEEIELSQVIRALKQAVHLGERSRSERCLRTVVLEVSQSRRNLLPENLNNSNVDAKTLQEHQTENIGLDSNEADAKLESSNDDLNGNDSGPASFPRNSKMKRADLKETPEERIRFQASRNGIVVFETITQSFSLAHLTYDFVERYGPQAVDQLDQLLIEQAAAKTNLEKDNQGQDMKICSGPRWFKWCNPGLCDDSATPSRDPATKIPDADVVESIKENGALSSFDAETVVYSFLPQQFSRFLGPMIKLQVAFYLYNKTWDSHCIILNGDDRILVGFRGTVSTLNARADLDLSAIPYRLSSLVAQYASEHVEEAKFVEKKASKMLVHRGFTNSFAPFEKSILECVTSLLKENPRKVLCTTGHSLGGALATICALSFKLNFNIRTNDYCSRVNTKEGAQKVPILVCCHTYGSPKVGNHVFKEVFQTLIPSCLRLVFVGDLIPSLPPSRPFATLTKKGYFHVGTRIILDLHGNLVIAPSFVEGMIYNALKGFKLQRHFKGSYSLGLMSWNARTNGSDFTPDWWLPIISHLFINFSEEIYAFPEEIKSLLLYQLCKNEAIYVVNKTVYRHAVSQTDDTEEKSTNVMAIA